jgi:hypothetical protein
LLSKPRLLAISGEMFWTVNPRAFFFDAVADNLLFLELSDRRRESQFLLTAKNLQRDVFTYIRAGDQDRQLARVFNRVAVVFDDYIADFDACLFGRTTGYAAELLLVAAWLGPGPEKDWQQSNQKK